MNTYALYYTKYCPFCQTVLMYLSGKEHQIELLSTTEATNHKTLVQGGGKGQVPCLRIENSDGKVGWMYESNDILRYINKHNLAVQSA